MEETTSYRYEALNDGSYNELAAYAINLVGNVSLFPSLRTIIIDGKFANDVSKFINKENLGFFTTPIKIDEHSLGDIINTEAIDADTLRKVAHTLLGKMNDMAEHNETIIQVQKERDMAQKDCKMYRDMYLEKADKVDRIKEQIQAIGTLIDAIFPGN